VVAPKKPLFQLPMAGGTDVAVQPSPRLPRVVRIARTAPLLHAAPLNGDGEVLSLNIAQGCAHRCAFCFASAYPSYPGNDVVYLFDDTPTRLAAELRSRRNRPRAVYISPATDPFMPLPEVQAETAAVVEVLAEHGVEAWLMTRGFIRPAIGRRLAAQRARVQVTVGLTTLDRRLQRLLEPLAAPPRLRLEQIARLREQGIAVQVELAPLVPGVTDSRDNLEPLLAALARCGIRRVMTGYLFLRPAIGEQLVRALSPYGLDEPVLSAFDGGPMLQEGTIAAARYLPKVRRQRGYAALMALASRHGIAVTVSGLTNPDFRLPPPPPDPAPRQRLLPQLAGWQRTL
jgi:DNA repair photolyase